jgi:hypothetical protein
MVHTLRCPSTAEGCRRRQDENFEAKRRCTKGWYEVGKVPLGQTGRLAALDIRPLSARLAHCPAFPKSAGALFKAR